MKYILVVQNVDGNEHYAIVSDKTKEQLNDELNLVLNSIERGIFTFEGIELYKSKCYTHKVITLNDFWEKCVNYTKYSNSR